MLRDFLAIGAGGALGASLRYVLSIVTLSALDQAFLFGAAPANVLGALAIGWLAASPLPAAWRPFLLTGFCGGFTTFSLFSLELLVLFGSERVALAVAYGLCSVAVWIAAVWVGYRLGGRAKRTNNA